MINTCRNGNHRQNTVFCFAILAAHQGGIPKIVGEICQKLTCFLLRLDCTAMDVINVEFARRKFYQVSLFSPS